MVAASFGNVSLNLLLGVIMLVAVVASILAITSLAGVFEFGVSMTNQPGWHRGLTTGELTLILLFSAFVAIVAFAAMWKINVA